jgi:Fe-S cluster assembly protein SufB
VAPEGLQDLGAHDGARWAKVQYPPIDYQAICYYSAPKKQAKSLDEVDPDILAMYEKLGVPLKERAALAGVAVDAVFDSVSVGTTFKGKLAELGIIFCSFSEAVQEHPDLVRKYLGSVVPTNDNFFAALNSAVFTDGSFCYVPKGVKCPMELSTYFRINAAKTGQFERTLLIADEGASVSYLEGCTAPMRDENQLHAAVVELVALDRAELKYSTVQNWYPGDKDGKGGIYNFVTSGGPVGIPVQDHLDPGGDGSAITWKYPSCILQGDESVGEFYSVAVVHHRQQADTGTKLIHLGKDTKSTIISKGISAGHAQNTYRGLVRILPAAESARNFTQCDSLLMGPTCGAHTVPMSRSRPHGAGRARGHHLQDRRGPDLLLPPAGALQRGCREPHRERVLQGSVQQVAVEFAVEAQKLLGVTLREASDKRKLGVRS